MRQTATNFAAKAGKLSINKTTAVVVWLFGAWLSARAGAQMVGYDITGWQSPPFQALIVAIGAQWLLTRAQSPFWRWRLHNRAVPAQVTTIAIGSLTIDTLINAGGIWPLAQGLGKVDAWKLIQAITSCEPTPTQDITQGMMQGAAQGACEPSMLAMVALALFGGVVIAGFAEYFWNLED